MHANASLYKGLSLKVSLSKRLPSKHPRSVMKADEFPDTYLTETFQHISVL